MGAPDLTGSTTFNANPTDITGLAISLGRIEESQKYMRDGIDEVKKTVGGVADTVASHSIALSRIDTKIAEHDNMFAEARPVKSGWPTVLASVGGIVGVAFGVLIALLHP
jgi:hypothetical protein